MSSKLQGRRPLTEVQKASGSPRENEMVGRQQTTINNKLGVKSSSDSPNGSKNALSKVKSGTVVKKKVGKILVCKEVQTENGDASMVTGEEAPLEYWKQLAESRREALEETLEENCTLHQRIEELEKEKALLEEMVEQAKTLASMLEDLGEENPDESGIAFSSDKTADDSSLEKE